MSISIGDATAAIRRAAAPSTVVHAAGTMSNGRPSPLSWEVDTADLIVSRAAERRWVADDPDGYRLHVLTPGGRWYRIAAAAP